MKMKKEIDIDSFLKKSKHILDELEALLEAELALAEMTKLELEDFKRKKNQMR